MKNSELKRHTEIKRGGPLRRVSAKRAAGETKAPTPKRTDPTATTRALVKTRDGDCCARCGFPVPGPRGGNVHHRRSRGAGGSSDPQINKASNLVLLCGSPMDFCHGAITRNDGREQALADGWVLNLNSTIDPATVPVRHHLHGLVLLDNHGGYKPAERRAA